MAFLFGSFLMLGGIGALVVGLNKYQLRQRIRNTPTSTPGAVALGLSEVTGTAQPAGDTLRAPLEDRPCLLYHYAFLHLDEDQDANSNDSDERWKAFKYGTHGVPFLLEGERGSVWIDPTDADLRIPSRLWKDLCFGDPPDSSVFWEASNGPPPAVEAFQQRCDELFDARVDLYRLLEQAEDPGIFWSQSLKAAKRTEAKSSGQRALVVEQVVPGDELYILGTAQPPPEDPSVPDDVSAVFQRTETPDPASKSFLERLTSPFGQWSSDYESVFTISSQSEEELIETTQSNEQIQLFGGLLIFGIGLFILLGVAL